ncbi:MAG: MFS transporter [Brachybacterium sp.]|nr:MFS transporter [Brachybacterium sp.]
MSAPSPGGRPSPSDRSGPAVADPDHYPEVHAVLIPAGPERRRGVRAFAAWDGGMSAFNSIILTFVFVTYVTSGVAASGVTGDEAVAEARTHGANVVSAAQTAGAVLIALLAPLLGNLADAGGRRNLLLRVFTLATIVVIASMVFVREDPDYLWLGAALIAIAMVLSELAGVFVNSVLPQISTPENRGRVSGTAWAIGYWGSILSLALVLVLFVMPGTGLLGLPAEDGWNLRAIPLFVALWILVLTIPLMRRAPAMPRQIGAERWTPWQGYADIGRRLVRAFRQEPVMLHFLIASAIYRDGLGAIFSLAAVIAAAAYGFDTTDVIFFGIAANLVAGTGVFLGGKADDRFGTRRVIIAGCAAIIVLGIGVVLVHSELAFWIGGLAICLFVGPIQSASRNLLTRLSDPGRETENFGLYAMTGRAMGFLGTGAFSLAVLLTGDVRFGMVGIIVVLALGLLAFLPARLGEAGMSQRTLAGAPRNPDAA